MTTTRPNFNHFCAALRFIEEQEAYIAAKDAKTRELADDLLSKVNQFGGIVANMHKDIFATHESITAATGQSQS